MSTKQLTVLIAILLALAGGLAILYEYIINANTAQKLNLISADNFLDNDSSVIREQTSNSQQISEDSQKLIDNYKLLYAIGFQGRPDMVRTAHLYFIGEDKDIIIPKPDNASVYELAVSDSGAAVCFIISEKNDLPSTKIVKVSNFSVAKTCMNGKVILDDLEAKYPNLIGINNSSFNSYEDLLLFNALNTQSNTWEIYLLNILEGKLEKLADGMLPFWVDEDEFVYLSSGGIMIHNVRSSSSKLVYKLNNAGFHTPISYSKKSNKLVWSFPYKGKSLILSLVKDGPNVLGARKITEINKGFVAPFALSDDGRFVAYLDVNPDQWYAQKVKTVPVRIFDLQTRTQVKTLAENISELMPYSFTIFKFWR